MYSMYKPSVPKISLSIFGNLKRAAGEAASTVASKFDWGNAVADSAILAMINFFGAFVGVSAVGLPTLTAVVAAGMSASFQFFMVLAGKRGLIKPEGQAS